MAFITRFAAFWYDFIVGDDWFVAVGVLVCLGLAAILARGQADAFASILLPLGVAVVLTTSVFRATRAH
jgi:uncharacterized membrane protein